MIDEDEAKHDHSDAQRHNESLLYDLGKFLTSLSIFALGGVLTVADTAKPGDIKPFNLITITIALAGAAVFGASTAGSIAFCRFTGKPFPRQLHNYARGSFLLLGVGLGMFMGMWIDKLY
jgi:hypothetical protein